MKGRPNLFGNKRMEQGSLRDDNGQFDYEFAEFQRELGECDLATMFALKPPAETEPAETTEERKDS